MTDEELAAIEARAAAATPGPWYVVPPPWDRSGTFVNALSEDPHGGTPICDTEHPRSWADVGNGELDTTREDAEFIAEARTDVPALVAEVRRLRAEMVRLYAVEGAALYFYRSVRDDWPVHADEARETLRVALGEDEQ